MVCVLTQPPSPRHLPGGLAVWDPLIYRWEVWASWPRAKATVKALKAATGEVWVVLKEPPTFQQLKTMRKFNITGVAWTDKVIPERTIRGFEYRLIVEWSDDEEEIYEELFKDFSYKKIKIRMIVQNEEQAEKAKAYSKYLEGIPEFHQCKSMTVIGMNNGVISACPFRSDVHQQSWCSPIEIDSEHNQAFPCPHGCWMPQTKWAEQTVKEEFKPRNKDNFQATESTACKSMATLGFLREVYHHISKMGKEVDPATVSKDYEVLLEELEHTAPIPTLNKTRIQDYTSVEEHDA